MSNSRPEDNPADDRTTTQALNPDRSDLAGQNSKSSRDRSSTRSGENSKESESSRSKCLNPYGLSPTTVPPFALDEQSKLQKLRRTQNETAPGPVTEEELGRYCKDPFLVSHNKQWVPFVKNVGSNVAYFHKAIKPTAGSLGDTLYEDDAGHSSNTGSTVGGEQGDSSSGEEAVVYKLSLIHI